MLKGTDLTITPLFDSLSLTLDDGARAGLVGANGIGKTTLLRLLAGVAAPDRGAVAAGVGDRVGYLPQDVLDPRSTIDDLLRRALGEVWEVRLELDAHERDLVDLDAYGAAQERFEALGGWALEARLDEALRRLGIDHLDRGARLGKLSGGEAARCLLASVLLGDPTVLLLDEPTNHLDADGREWLAEWLAELRRDAAVRLARSRLPRRHRGPHLRALARRAGRVRGRLHRVRRGEGPPARAAHAARRGAGQEAPPAGGRHRHDCAPGAVQRAHHPAADRAEVQALRQEGGQEVQGA